MAYGLRIRDYGVLLTCRGNVFQPVLKSTAPFTSPDPPAGRRSVPVTLRPAWTGIYGVDCTYFVGEYIYYISPGQCHCLQHSAGPTLPRTPQYTPAQFPGPSSTVQPRVFNGKHSLFPRDSSSQIQPLSKFQPPRSAETPPRPNQLQF